MSVCVELVGILFPCLFHFRDACFLDSFISFIIGKHCSNFTHKLKTNTHAARQTTNDRWLHFLMFTFADPFFLSHNQLLRRRIARAS